MALPAGFFKSGGRIVNEDGVELIALQDAAATKANWSVYRLLSAATTNLNTVKASAAELGGWYLSNSSAAKKYVKLYNKASNPVLASDTPKMTLELPAGSAANVTLSRGVDFPTGIAIAITGAVGDTDTTAVAANDVVVNLLYV